MKSFGAYIPIVAIIGLVLAAVFAGRFVDKPKSPNQNSRVAWNLTSIDVSPFRITVPVNATSINLSVSAIHSQNGSSSGAMKIVTDNIIFKSNNENVAVVSAGGQVTGITAGTTTVTVTYTEGNTSKAKDVTVTVTQPAGT